MNTSTDSNLRIGDFVLNKKTGEFGKIFEFDKECVFVHIKDFNFELWSTKDIEKYFANYS